jgi:hypothetical protein
MLLAIESNKRSFGTNTLFTIMLNPGITFSRIRLKFASICNAQTNTELYYFITIGNLQVNARACNMSGNAGTFIIPTLSAGGSRNIFQAESDFKEIADGCGIHLNSLEIKIHTPDGAIAPDSGANLIILELE